MKIHKGVEYRLRGIYKTDTELKKEKEYIEKRYITEIRPTLKSVHRQKKTKYREDIYYKKNTYIDWRNIR